MGGIFDSYNNSQENINNLKSGRIFNNNNIKINEYIGEVYRVLKNSSHCYIFSNWSNLNEIITETEKVGFKLQNILVWEKDNKVCNKYYMNQTEFILFFRKGNSKNINNMGNSNLLKISNVKNKMHPTEKPTELMKILIENSSNKNDIVLDCFMGSGSTGIACLESGRKFIGIEIDDKFFNIAEQRIKDM